MKKLAVIGGNGMLGYDLRHHALKAGYSVKVFDLPEYNITNNRDLERIVDSSDLIVNCAAYTAVDKAETDKHKCFEINANAVGRLGEYVKKYGKYLVHISTDFVFGDYGEAPLKETDQVNPLSVYGKSKQLGEELLIDSGAQAAIIRVQWTYGRNNDNFISKIIKLTSSLDAIKVVNDQVGSPTPVTLAAKAIVLFLDKKITGLFHFASEGYASRYEVAKFIATELNIKTNIIPCLSNEFITPAVRPVNSRFDCSRIDKILNFRRPPWEESLHDYLCISPETSP